MEDKMTAGKYWAAAVREQSVFV